MVCPLCGYVLDPFEKECARCHGKGYQTVDQSDSAGLQNQIDALNITCPKCGHVRLRTKSTCPMCAKVARIGEAGDAQPPPLSDEERNRVYSEERLRDEAKNWTARLPDEPNSMLWVGYLFAIGSLFVFPPGFGLAGFVVGVINITRQHNGHGIAQIILSVIFGTIGMMWGAASWYR